MPNYKIVLEYDGTNFLGWQFQSKKRTVQGEIESALQKLNGGQPVRINGAGRTDTGVHARGQVANFILDKMWSCDRLRHAINGNIKDDVYIKKCELVPDDFHSRYSAKRRAYRYYCRIDDSIIDRNYVWRIAARLNQENMQTCADLILGENDFTSFSKCSSDLEHRRCIIYQSKWIKHGNFLIYNVEANRFLHHLIRFLVGTMVEVGKENISFNNFKQLLITEDPKAKVFKAPSTGLYFERVTY